MAKAEQPVRLIDSKSEAVNSAVPYTRKQGATLFSDRQQTLKTFGHSVNFLAMFGRGAKLVDIGKIRLPLALVLNAYDLPEKRPGVFFGR